MTALEVEEKAQKQGILSDRQLASSWSSVNKLEKSPTLRESAIYCVSSNEDRRYRLHPLVLPVKEIYGSAASFLDDCRTLIVPRGD